MSSEYKFEIGKEHVDYDKFGGGSDVFFWAQRLNNDLRLTPISPRLISLDEESLGQAVRSFLNSRPGDNYLSFKIFKPRIDDSICSEMEHSEIVRLMNAACWDAHRR